MAIVVANQTLPDDLTTQSETLALWVQRTQIRGDDSLERAAEALANFQSLRREITKFFSGVKRPINEALKQVRAVEKTELAKISPPESKLQAMILVWMDKQHNIREAAAAEALSDNGQTLFPAEVNLPAGHYVHVTRSVVVKDASLVIAELAEGRLPMSLVTDKVVAALETQLNRVLAREGDLFNVPGCVVRVKRTPVAR
jgi:ribosomal protein S8